MANDIINSANNVRSWETLIQEEGMRQMFDLSGFAKNKTSVASPADSPSDIFTDKPTPLQDFTSLIGGRSS